MPSERVHRVFVASTSGFDNFEQPEYIFHRLFSKDRVSMEEVSGSMKRDHIPETATAVDEILGAYGGWDGCIGVAEFSSLLHDLFSSAPYQYTNLLKSLWGQ